MIKNRGLQFEGPSYYLVYIALYGRDTTAVTHKICYIALTMRNIYTEIEKSMFYPFKIQFMLSLYILDLLKICH